MTMIDTSTWLTNSDIHQNTTSALNTYVNNGINQYTLVESSSRYTSGGNRERSCGIKVINSPNTSSGFGKSVRPPQRMTRALTGGGHVHFIPNLENIRLYGAVQEGSSGIPSPTGVIGLGIETLRLSSVDDTTNFPNGNDAEMEIDVWIYDPEDDTKFAYLLNYPISNTGLGTNWDPFTAQSVLWRGALGVSKFDRTFLYHNTQSGAWHFENWSLNEMWHDTSSWVINYRIHDVVSPYTITNNVSLSASFNNPGVYEAISGVELAVSGINALLLAGGGQINAPDAPVGVFLAGGGALDFANDRILLDYTPYVVGSGSLRFAGGGELHVGAPVVRLLGVDALRLDAGGSISEDTGAILLSGGNTLEGLGFDDIGSLIVDGFGSSGKGFIPTVIYWYRR